MSTTAITTTVRAEPAAILTSNRVLPQTCRATGFLCSGKASTGMNGCQTRRERVVPIISELATL
ncbi:MAG: hypothetical protein ACP5H2_09990 [Solirubrobacteraceae bacterium]